MAKDILVKHGKEDYLLVTFKAGGIIPFNSPVKLSAAGTVVQGTGADSIGWATDDAVIEATNANAQYVANDLVRVKVKGEILEGTATASLAVGNFIKGAAAGRYAPEDTVTTRTAVTEGVVITPSTGAGAKFEFMRL